jgi:hypothetical protein
MTWKTLFVLGLNYLDTLRPDIPDVVLPNLPNGEFLQRKIRRHSAEHLFDIYFPPSRPQVPKSCNPLPSFCPALSWKWRKR